MKDATILFTNEGTQLGSRMDAFTEELTRAGGHCEWATVPTDLQIVLNEYDLRRIADWGCIPSDMTYSVLMVDWNDHYTTAAERQATRQSMHTWDELKDDFGAGENEIDDELVPLLAAWPGCPSAPNVQNITGRMPALGPLADVDYQAVEEAVRSSIFGDSDMVSVPVITVDSQGAPGDRRTMQMSRSAYDRLIQVLEDAGMAADTPVRLNVSGDINPCAEIPLSSGDDYRRRRASDQAARRQMHGMTTQGQRAGFQRRQETAQNWVIDWNETVTWTIPAPEQPGNFWTYQIVDMEDKHLWESVIWMVRGVKDLYQHYAIQGLRGSLALEAKCWLRVQPLFRSLMQQAIRQRLTFPQDVYRYLREYVLDRRTDDVQVTMPWQDPGAAYQISNLEGFLDEPLEIPNVEGDYGKQLRDIDLGDE